jgi:hypothetical protein
MCQDRVQVSVNWESALIGRHCNKKFAKQAIRVLFKSFVRGSLARGRLCLTIVSDAI